MNRFATIVEAVRFKKVVYYTITFEDEAPLFEQFINNHNTPQYAEDLSIIRSWLKKIGDEVGATQRYFRSEGFRKGSAQALPPPARFLDISCQLRLYCMRINSEIVILFNGAEKTKQTAQECDQVRPHFLLANRLTSIIDNLIIEKEIIIDDHEGCLLFDENLKFEIPQ